MKRKLLNRNLWLPMLALVIGTGAAFTTHTNFNGETRPDTQNRWRQIKNSAGTNIQCTQVTCSDEEGPLCGGAATESELFQSQLNSTTCQTPEMDFVYYAE